MDIVVRLGRIRRRTGYLPGGIAIYDSLSGEDALDYLNDLQGRPPVRREELCERLQMPASVLKRKVRDYSRGMRQKLGVIQALQHDPDLAMLDEPTEGLDPLMQQAFYGIMDDLRARGPHDLLLQPRAVGGGAHLRPGGDHPRRPPDGARSTSTSCWPGASGTIHLRWREGVPDLSSVPGLADVKVDGDRLSATLLGEVAPFVRAVASPMLVDLTIEPARLEEAFLEFYAEDEPPEEVRQ